jgi:hypothetical protein
LKVSELLRLIRGQPDRFERFTESIRRVLNAIIGGKVRGVVRVEVADDSDSGSQAGVSRCLRLRHNLYFWRRRRFVRTNALCEGRATDQ